MICLRDHLQAVMRNWYVPAYRSQRLLRQRDFLCTEGMGGVSPSATAASALVISPVTVPLRFANDNGSPHLRGSKPCLS